MVLYYFSATGNTLSTARMLAREIPEECRLIPIAALRDEGKITVSDDAVGFLFPIYGGDLPYLVRDTIERMEFEGEPYIFGVCTYRGSVGPSAARLNLLLTERGQKLAHYDAVSLPGNSRLSTQEHIVSSLASQEENVRKAAERIKNREREDYSSTETPKPTAFSSGYANVRHITADENCVGCGMCAAVCPMDNVDLTSGHAEFGERCITCLACFHWCPVEAVYMAGQENGRREKYHHPDVTADDIIAEKTL